MRNRSFHGGRSVGFVWIETYQPSKPFSRYIFGVILASSASAVEIVDYKELLDLLALTGRSC